MSERTCIVTRQVREPDELIRFVAGPDGAVVPDLKRNLPGRGCWVGASRALVDKAVAKKLFARALRVPAAADPDLGGMVDALLARHALGALGLARKAGAVALGAAKVEATVRSGKAAGVVHAFEAADDGIRKIAAARRFAGHMGAGDIPAFRLFGEAELSLALGGANVIHAALLDRDVGRAALKRLRALEIYRGEAPENRLAPAADAAKDMAVAAGAAEDTE